MCAMTDVDARSASSNSERSQLRRAFAWAIYSAVRSTRRGRHAEAWAGTARAAVWELIYRVDPVGPAAVALRRAADLVKSPIAAHRAAAASELRTARARWLEDARFEA